MEDARAAAALSQTSESCAPMFALIDADSVLMLDGVPATERVGTRTPVDAQ
jgi:hypothetical protein